MRRAKLHAESAPLAAFRRDNYEAFSHLSFRPDALRMLLLRNKISTLDELKQTYARIERRESLF